MAGLAFVNPALAVEAIGFAPWSGHWLGVLLTPWCMNLVLTPHDPAQWSALPVGAKRRYAFPAGDYEFIGARDDAIGEYQMCSLFSPVFEFTDQPTARLVGQLARDALLDAANAEAPAAHGANLAPPVAAPSPLARLEENLGAPLSKRDLLHGRFPDRGHVPRG
jgi:[NiFe] hydrogenase assembly HybE family chaperone